jgi:hypothetical protein
MRGIPSVLIMHVQRSWSVYHRGERVGGVRASDPVEALALARRAYPDCPGCVVSPDADAGEGDGGDEAAGVAVNGEA